MVVRCNAVIYVCILILFSVGCASQEDPVKKDLKWYVNSSLDVFDIEVGALEAFDNVSGKNYKSDAVMKAALKNKVLPKLKEFLQKMEVIRPQTNEVSGLHRLYLKKTRIHIEAFETLSEALKRGDKIILDEAMKLIKRKDLLYKKWLAKLEEMKKKYEL